MNKSCLIQFNLVSKSKYSKKACSSFNQVKDFIKTIVHPLLKNKARGTSVTVEVKTQLCDLLPISILKGLKLHLLLYKFLITAQHIYVIHKLLGRVINLVENKNVGGAINSRLIHKFLNNDQVISIWIWLALNNCFVC